MSFFFFFAFWVFMDILVLFATPLDFIRRPHFPGRYPPPNDQRDIFLSFNSSVGDAAARSAPKRFNFWNEIIYKSLLFFHCILFIYLLLSVWRIKCDRLVYIYIMEATVLFEHILLRLTLALQHTSGLSLEFQSFYRVYHRDLHGVICPV